MISSIQGPPDWISVDPLEVEWVREFTAEVHGSQQPHCEIRTRCGDKFIVRDFEEDIAPRVAMAKAMERKEVGL